MEAARTPASRSGPRLSPYRLLPAYTIRSSSAFMGAVQYQA